MKKRHFLHDETNTEVLAPSNAQTTTVTPAAARVSPPAVTTQSDLEPYIKELRNEAATFRIALRDAEKTQDVTKQELEALKAQLATKDAELAATVERVKAEVAQEYTEKTRIANIKAAVKDVLMDVDELDALNLNGLKLTDTGSIEGIDAFLAELKTKRPYLFRDFHAAPTSTNKVFSRTVNSDGTPINDVSKLAPADYEKQKRDFLKNNK